MEHHDGVRLRDGVHSAVANHPHELFAGAPAVPRRRVECLPLQLWAVFGSDHYPITMTADAATSNSILDLAKLTPKLDADAG